jgi:hypothetical protein
MLMEKSNHGFRDPEQMDGLRITWLSMRSLVIDFPASCRPDCRKYEDHDVEDQSHGNTENNPKM